MTTKRWSALPKKMSEDDMQIAIIQQCALYRYNGHKVSDIVRHVPNGGKRNVVEAKKFKAMGVIAGTPDLLVPVPRDDYGALWIELKTKDGTLSDKQGTQITLLRSLGHRVIVCRSIEHAVSEIKNYLGI